MRALFTLGALCMLAMSFALAGCSRLECGPDTFASGNTCLGFDPDDTTPPTTTISPPGGRSRDALPELVTLTTDEPARIYYTTDGTDPDPTTMPGEASPVVIVGVHQGMTVKYLAVDRAGNQAAVASATYESDREPPPAVTDLAVTIDGTAATVSWQHPAGSDHVASVIARLGSAMDAYPTPGKTYTAGEAISPSIHVLAVGSMTTFVDPARPPGPARYAVWAVDDLGNYSVGAVARADIALPALTASLTYDPATDALTAAAGAAIDLAGSTAVLDGTTLTISLVVTNRTSAHFANPKLLFSVSGGATVTNADGTLGGQPYRRLDALALPPSTPMTRQLVLGGITSGTPYTIDVTLRHDPIASSMHARNTRFNTYDLSTATLHAPRSLSGYGPNDRLGGRPRPGIRTGGRFLDVPSAHATIDRHDLVTGLRVDSVTLAEFGVRSNVVALISREPYLIAVIKHGGHRGTGRIELVRLDEAFTVIERVMQTQSYPHGFRRVEVADDGATLAVPVVGGVQLYDLDTLAPIDADPATPGVDPVPTTVTNRIAAVTLFDGADGMLVIGRNLNGTVEISVARRGANGYTASSVGNVPGGVRPFNTALAPDGKVWIALSTTGLRVFDPATNTLSTVSYPHQPQGVNRIGDQLWVIRQTRIHLDQINASGAIQQTLTLPQTGAVHGHWITTAP